MNAKPIVLITGAAGVIGSRLVKALTRGYRVVGMDRAGREAETSSASPIGGWA